MQFEKWLKTQTAFLTFSGLLALVVTFLLYGSVTAIPFYSDDLLQIPWARSAPMDEIWGTLNPFDHFRPVQFSLWRIWQWVAGDLNPLPLRLFNLLMHAGSGCLTGFLAFRLSQRDWFAGIGSTLLFILFPFSYDAILWISSAAYPLAVLLGLLSVHSWMSFTRPSQIKNWGWLFASFVFAVASALSLESGILVGIVLIIIDILIYKRFTWLRIGVALSASIIPFSIINFLTPTPASPFELERFIQNGAMVAQATTFPFSYLLIWLPDGFDPAMLLWLIGLIFFGFVAVISYRSEKLFHALTFGFIWISLWGVIPAVTQTYTWDRDPPRAFYPCAVGVALVWGLLLASRDDKPVPMWKRFGYRIALGMALLVPISFNNQISRTYQQAGNLLEQVLVQVEASDDASSHLFVNLPERLGPTQQTWLLGYEGVIPMPPPTDDVRLFFEVNVATSPRAENKINGTILDLADQYEIGLAGSPLVLDDLRQLESESPLNIYAAEYMENESRLVYIGQLENSLTAADQEPPFDYLFEDQLALTIGGCAHSEETSALLTLNWLSLDERLDPSRSIFVHLWQDGEIVDQADGQFLSGLLPIGEFASNDYQLREQRELTLLNDSPYKIGLGLYNPADGERSSVIDSNGNSIDDNYIWLECQG